MLVSLQKMKELVLITFAYLISNFDIDYILI